MSRRFLFTALLTVITVPALAAPPVVTGLDLLDSNGVLITPLESNNLLDLNMLGERTLLVRANVNGPGSIHFQGSGIERTVNSAPYIMGGASGATYGAWMPESGTYTLTATPWEGADATGAQGSPVTITVTVVDVLNFRMRPVRIQSNVPHAEVQVRMLDHEFPFGSMMKETSGFSPTGTTSDEIMYRNVFLSNFNYSVAGNAMKWYSQQPDWWSQSPHNTGYAKPGNYRYADADNLLAFLQANDIPMRGHTIYWGADGSSSGQMWDPDWLENIASDTEALYWIEQRALNLVSRYAGQIDEWDFNNELWHEDYYTNRFGTAITKQMADWAIAANPDIKLWFNEYGMLNNTNNSASFLAYLQTLQGQGVQIDGVGVQGHFGQAPNPATVKASLDILDDLGVPIKVTEFDCGWAGATEAQEADGLEAVYRTAFEHQAVEGIIMWGFWEGSHWKPERALWNLDWTPTEQALRYQSLVFDEWWSDADLFADQNGELSMNLFAGDFEITIDGKTFTLSIPAGNQTLQLAYDGTDLSVQPGSGVWTELTNDDFESGWGNWLDGGTDAMLSGVNAIGATCMNLQDNTTTSESQLAAALDLTGYSQLEIAFTYITANFTGAEDFWVRFSDDGGSTWTTIKAYVNGVDFSNGIREYPVLIINDGQYNFTQNVKIKFECDASGNNDDVYIDNVVISGFEPNLATYEMWAVGHGLTGPDALGSADLEPDGLDNFHEYAFGGNPDSADPATLLPAFSMVSDSGTNWVEYVYRRRNDHVLRGLVYRVETTTNLVSDSWNTNGVIEVGSAALDDEFDTVTNRISAEVEDQQFIRLQIELTP